MPRQPGQGRRVEASGEHAVGLAGVTREQQLKLVGCQPAGIRFEEGAGRLGRRRRHAPMDGFRARIVQAPPNKRARRHPRHEAMLPGCGAAPHRNQAAHGAAREAAARGVGVPASDRAGVWGSAPQESGRARRGPRGSGAWRRGPRERPSRGVGQRPTGIRPRTARPARQRRVASGSPRATEPGCRGAPQESGRARRGPRGSGGVPASDRAGVWGSAPQESGRARRGPRGSGAWRRGPRERPSRGVGQRPTGIRPRTARPARQRRGASGSPRATEPGCGAAPHRNQAAHGAAREAAARGVGVPASDRAGVWGSAPQESGRARRGPRGSGAGRRGPRERPSRGVGQSPTGTRRRADSSTGRPPR